MNYLVLYDQAKEDEIVSIADNNKSVKVIRNTVFWKIRYRIILNRVDNIIVFKSSIAKSKNVKWELGKLRAHDVLIVINDIPDSEEKIVTAARVISVQYEHNNLSKCIKDAALSIGLESMFESEFEPGNAKDFMFKMLETSESLINRRQNTNNYMLTANGILITLIGVLLGIESIRKEIFPIILLPVIGLIICYSWFSLLTSYGKLNKAKFEVICFLESKIGFPIFGAEWKYLSKKSVSYKSFTKTERWLPVLFCFVYIAIIVIMIVCEIPTEGKGETLWRTISL